MRNLTDIIPPDVVLTGTVIFIGSFAAYVTYELYKKSKSYRRRVAKRRIEKGLPPFDDGQLYFDFVRDYL